MACSQRKNQTKIKKKVFKPSQITLKGLNTTLIKRMHKKKEQKTITMQKGIFI